MPSISPGFIGNSRSLLLGKGPDMNLLLRQRLSHCFQPWPALRSSVQSIILVSGGQRKRHFHITKYVWRLTYMCCTCKNKKNICVSPYPLITHWNKYCRLKLLHIWAYILVGSVQAFLPTLPALRCAAGSPCTEHLLYPDMQNT